MPRCANPSCGHESMEYETVWHGATWRDGWVEPPKVDLPPERTEFQSTKLVSKHVEDAVLRVLNGRTMKCRDLQDALPEYSRTGKLNALNRLMKRGKVIGRKVPCYGGLSWIYALAGQQLVVPVYRREKLPCSSCGGERDPKSAMCKACRREYDRNRRANKLEAA